MNGEATKRYTIEELRARRAREGSRSDWNRVDAQSDTDVAAAIGQDPDAEEPMGSLEEAILVTPDRKVAISIRLDRDVLDFYRAAGPGYQTRINDVLRRAMKPHHRHAG